MNRHLSHLLTLCCSIVAICSCKPADTSQIGIINIPDALNSIGLVNLSEVAKSIKYIPLETTEESLIGEIINILYDKDHIYVTDISGAIKIFDDEGRYLRSIKRLGRGPEEYSTFISASLVDKNIAVTGRDIVEYDILGNFIRRVGIPEVPEYRAFTPVALGENSYIALLVSLSTKQEYCAVIYDSLLNIRKMVAAPNPSGAIAIPGDASGAVFLQPAKLFRHNGETRIFCPESTEILSMDKFDAIDTAFVIDYGQYRVPDGITINSSASSKHVSPLSFLESEDYLFMNMSTRATINGTYTANFLYNKQTMQTRVLYDNIGQKRGFKDDLGGGPEFWPRSTSNDKLLISSASAILIMEHPFGNAASAEIKQIVAELTESSNPVITIVELK